MRRTCHSSFKPTALIFAALVWVAPWNCSAVAQTLNDAARADKQWAQKIEKDGLPNLHRVTDALYRGAQPTEQGFRELRKMGVRTVVSLRSFHSDRKLIGATPLAYEHIYMKAWHPEDEEIVRFLRIVTDPARQPVFLHCQHGADRTGTMCAIYRVVVCGWTKDEAIKEMTEGKFGFWEKWQNLVKYIRELDVDEIRRKAELGVNSAPQKGSR
jgi:protein tyrosine/serine phosphatase